MSFLRLLFIILFLIPSVNALDVNIKNNSNIKLNKKPAEVLYNNRISNNLERL